MKNLNGIQFSARPSTIETDPTFSAYDPSIKGEDKEVASMWLHPGTGEIDNVSVAPSHQRRGIATQLFEMAKIAHQVRPGGYGGYPHPEHSPARTADGNKWASAVGGRIPEEKKCTYCGEEGHLVEEEHPASGGW